MTKPKAPESSTSGNGGARAAFQFDCVRLRVLDLIPLKVLRPSVKASHKYQQILASIREVGLVEPPAVTADPKQRGRFLLLDGHLRIEALKDLSVSDVDCLVAENDDTYTFNKHINRLSAVQDHKMIVMAMERGVPVERLARALHVSATTILHRFRLLNGICDEAVKVLADKPCPGKVFDILRQMKPLRQIEAAELMVANKNYSVMLANATLAGTPENQLVATTKGTGREAVSVDGMARMEREIAALQMQIKGVEDTYGPDVLHLTVIRGYLTKLLGNAPVVRWLASNQPDYLREFQKLTDMKQLPVEEGVDG